MAKKDTIKKNKSTKKFVSTEAFRVSNLIVMPILCMPILFVWLVAIALKPIESKKNIYNNYIYPSEIKNNKQGE